MQTIPTQSIAHLRLESNVIYASASRYESPQVVANQLSPTLNHRSITSTQNIGN